MGQILAFPPIALPWPGEVDALDPAAALVLRTCLRPWVAAARRRNDPLPAVLAALRAEAAPEELGLSAHALMHGIALQALRVVEIGCEACPRLAPDEALLLHAVAEAFFGAEDPAGILAAFVHAPALAFLEPPIIGLARRMEQVGWRFRRHAPPDAPSLATPRCLH